MKLNCEWSLFEPHPPHGFFQFQLGYDPHRFFPGLSYTGRSLQEWRVRFVDGSCIGGSSCRRRWRSGYHSGSDRTRSDRSSSSTSGLQSPWTAPSQRVVGAWMRRILRWDHFLGSAVDSDRRCKTRSETGPDHCWAGSQSCFECWEIELDSMICWRPVKFLCDLE